MALTCTAIEPILPEQDISRLEDRACSVLEQAARLGAKVREPLRSQLVKLTRWMHTYYSNLIEGQQTRVQDIESALQKDFSAQPEKRNLQQLALAHLTMQRWAVTYAGSPFSSTFIQELHQRFYSELPQEMRVAISTTGKNSPRVPGELRREEVEVGSHLAPPHELVPSLLDHFSRRYSERGLSRVRQIIAVGASHHRLAWIHPFRDGNGRVVRLFSDTLIRQIGIDAGGLWSLSRGMAFHREQYYARLANADQVRSSASAADGRGHLSERALREFCEFVLDVMIDQIAYMDQLFDIDRLEKRIEHYVKLQGGFARGTEDRMFYLLREALYRGEFARGEAGRIVGAGERTGRAVLSLAEEAGLLQSDTPKSPVKLALPVKVLGMYFPQMFPPES
jgi:Fic family protein